MDKLMEDEIVDIVQKYKTKIKEMESKHRCLVENTHEGIVVSQDGLVKFINSAILENTGYSLEDIIGKSIVEFIHPDDKHMVIEYHNKRLKGTECSKIYSVRAIKKDGSNLWLSINSARIEWEGKPAVLSFLRDITKTKLFEEKFKQRFSQIIDFLPDPTFAIDKDGKVITWNKAMEEITRIKAEQMLGKGNYEYARPFYGNNRPILIDMVLNPNKKIQKSYTRFERAADNTLIGESFSPKLGIHLWGKARPLYDINGNIIGAIESIRDLTMIKDNEKKLIHQKECYEALFRNSSDAIVFFDRNHKVLDINSKFTELFGYTIEECTGKDVDELVTDEKTYSSAKYITETVFRGRYAETEAIRYTKNKRPIEVRIKAVLVVVNNEIVGGYGIYSNIGERKEYERKLKFLSIHDQLTGLYNRAFYEEELKLLSDRDKYPITIISADMDGLKIVNDTLGHSTGDELLKICAEILKKSIRRSDILARIGGDEFAIILPLTDEKAGEKILNRIRISVIEYNSKNPELQLHISLGVATAESNGVSLVETFKKADDLMYRDKLLRRNSARSQIINTLMAALDERDYITSGHVKRVKMLCMKMGEKLNLSSKQLADLALLAEVHDLGKVGIPDKILKKQGPLTKEEWKIMRQHPEKGYRIALSAPDLSAVADLILKHHERWDGKGYPLGLKALEIPIECRILSIVDAFDAMTSERPYSKKKTKEEAIDELRRCAGSQFDPDLVQVFLTIV